MDKAAHPSQNREDLVVEGRFQVLLIIGELETNKANHMALELLNKHFLEIPVFHHLMVLLDLTLEDTLLVVEEQMDILLTLTVAVVVLVMLALQQMLTQTLEVAVLAMHLADQQEVLALEELGVLVS